MVKTSIQIEMTSARPKEPCLRNLDSRLQVSNPHPHSVSLQIQHPHLGNHQLRRHSASQHSINRQPLPLLSASHPLANHLYSGSHPRLDNQVQALVSLPRPSANPHFLLLPLANHLLLAPLASPKMHRPSAHPRVLPVVCKLTNLETLLVNHQRLHSQVHSVNHRLPPSPIHSDSHQFAPNPAPLPRYLHLASPQHPILPQHLHNPQQRPQILLASPLPRKPRAPSQNHPQLRQLRLANQVRPVFTTLTVPSPPSALTCKLSKPPSHPNP